MRIFITTLQWGATQRFPNRQDPTCTGMRATLVTPTCGDTQKYWGANQNIGGNGGNN